MSWMDRVVTLLKLTKEILIFELFEDYGKQMKFDDAQTDLPIYPTKI